MRFKVMGYLPAACFTAVMLALVGIGSSVIASGHGYQGVSIITLGVWTWMAWAAGWGMHAWKRHAQVIADIRSSLTEIKTTLARPQADEPAAEHRRHLAVVPKR